MTVIVFDGKTLAADRQATAAGGRVYPATKLRRVRRLDGDYLLGGDGCLSQLLELFAWFEAGAEPADWPKSQVPEGFTFLWVVSPSGKAWHYEETPIPVPCEAKVFVSGAGGELALGALAMGATARKAVEVACLYHSGCGLGVDELTLA